MTRAPEHPFPCPLNDSYDGLLWVSCAKERIQFDHTAISNYLFQCKENASLLGVDPERIILSGSSAGANLVRHDRTGSIFNG